MKNDNNSFTVIEVIVVIAIICTVALIATPSVKQYYMKTHQPIVFILYGVKTFEAGVFLFIADKI